MSKFVLYLIIALVIAGIVWAIKKESKRPARKVTVIRCPNCGDKAYLYESGQWECTFCGDFGTFHKKK